MTYNYFLVVRTDNASLDCQIFPFDSEEQANYFQKELKNFYRTFKEENAEFPVPNVFELYQVKCLIP